MELSEKGLELAGIIIAVLAAMPVACWFGNFNLRYQKKHQNLNKLDSSRFYPIMLSVSVLLIAIAIWVLLRFPESKIIWVAGSLLEIVAAYYYFKPKYIHHNDDTDTQSIEGTSKEERGVKNMLLGLSVSPLFVNVLLYLAVTGFLLWFLPDVATVRDDGKRYDVKRYFALPFTKGMHPGGSYLDNETEDTLFRVLVSYSFPGVDKGNVYSITEAYPPGKWVKMKSRPDYVMKRLPPWMDPSNGRRGSYRTCRRFIVNRRQIDAFANLDMEKAGLKNNRLVDSIPEPKNSPIWEDKVKVNKYNAYW
ncbi:MAG: hypothetical protein K2I16_04150 [Muribaculaceae bacterium]|nr:hypothetical protein [Muribaculaceae bacterium]